MKPFTILMSIQNTFVDKFDKQAKISYSRKYIKRDVVFWKLMDNVRFKTALLLCIWCMFYFPIKFNFTWFDFFFFAFFRAFSFVFSFSFALFFSFYFFCAFSFYFLLSFASSSASFSLSYQYHLHLLLIYENMLKSIATARSECTEKHKNKASHNTYYIAPDLTNFFGVD